MAKGSYSTKFQPEQLRKLINQNKTSREITTELGISSFTLKEHLLLLQREDKKAYVINGLL
ncbi:MAG: AbrB/MazE/SpoVT family DNA-binding domain-containing protein, partial [Desulfopila sp.]